MAYLERASQKSHVKAQALFSMAASGSACAKEGQDEHANENDDHRCNEDQDADPARHLQAPPSIGQRFNVLVNTF